jgi:GAF domain-containing protein
MNEKRDFFKAFCTISKALGSTLSKEKLLDLIVENAVSMMDAKAACLFLADEGKDIFVPVAQTGLSENYLHAKPMRAKSIVGAILDGGHMYVRDATTDERMEHHDAKKAEGIASILVMPVIVRDKAIGVLSLYTAKPREFSQNEIEFLAALAEQGGIALDHARLLERIRNNSMLFLELASSINSSLDIKQIMHILTAETCERLGMKGASIRLLNPETKALDLVSTYGLSEKYQNKGPLSVKNKHVAEVLRGKTIVIDDVAKDGHLQYQNQAIEEGIVSMLCVPIKSREDVIGILRLASATQRSFPSELIALVEALAHTGALAIQNASMYLELQQDKECLEKDIWSHRSWF